MDDPNIIMEEYIRLEEEKARSHGKMYKWETPMYGRIWYDDDVHDLRSVETKFPTIVFNNALTSEVALSCKPTGLSGRMLMEHRDAQGQSMFTSRAWRRLFKVQGPLVHERILEFFSTFRFGEAVLDLDTTGAL
ncbi:hypothetical protein Tco_1506862 [Tanacetum coccineum]